MWWCGCSQVDGGAAGQTPEILAERENIWDRTPLFSFLSRFLAVLRWEALGRCQVCYGFSLRFSSQFVFSAPPAVLETRWEPARRRRAGAGCVPAPGPEEVPLFRRWKMRTPSCPASCRPP